LNVNTGISTDDIYIKSMLKAFKMVDMRCQYNDLIERAIENNLGYKEILKQLNLRKLLL
jgi:hypothetical protein